MLTGLPAEKNRGDRTRETKGHDWSFGARRWDGACEPGVRTSSEDIKGSHRRHQDVELCVAPGRSGTWEVREQGWLLCAYSRQESYNTSTYQVASEYGVWRGGIPKTSGRAPFRTAAGRYRGSHPCGGRQSFAVRSIQRSMHESGLHEPGTVEQGITEPGTKEPEP